MSWLQEITFNHTNNPNPQVICLKKKFQSDAVSKTLLRQNKRKKKIVVFRGNLKTKENQ